MLSWSVPLEQATPPSLSLAVWMENINLYGYQWTLRQCSWFWIRSSDQLSYNYGLSARLFVHGGIVWTGSDTKYLRATALPYTARQSQGVKYTTLNVPYIQSINSYSKVCGNADLKYSVLTLIVRFIQMHDILHTSPNDVTSNNNIELHQECMSHRRRWIKERRTTIDMLCTLMPYGHTLYGRPLRYRTNANLSFTLCNGLLPYKVKFGTCDYLTTSARPCMRSWQHPIGTNQGN